MAIATLLVLPAAARADGGRLQLSRSAGPYRVTVFTSPTPPRVGPVDVSVMVQDAATERILAGAEVTIAATDQTSAQMVRGTATSAAATNKLLQAATLELPTTGRWRIDVRVDAAAGAGDVGFELNVAPPLPRWVAMLPWFAWPLGVVVLFAASELARSRTSETRVAGAGRT